MEEQISELLFSLPFSNGRIESMFSLLKIIKTDRRTSLHTATLADLLEIRMEGPTVDKFSAEHVVSLWWEDSKTGRRVKQRPRKQYQHRASSMDEETESDEESDRTAAEEEQSASEEPTFQLDDWDKWFGPPSPLHLVLDSDSNSD